MIVFHCVPGITLPPGDAKPFFSLHSHASVWDARKKLLPENECSADGLTRIAPANVMVDAKMKGLFAHPVQTIEAYCDFVQRQTESEAITEHPTGLSLPLQHSLNSEYWAEQTRRQSHQSLLATQNVKGPGPGLRTNIAAWWNFGRRLSHLRWLTLPKGQLALLTDTTCGALSISDLHGTVTYISTNIKSTSQRK